jgi:hypothetical protein
MHIHDSGQYFQFNCRNTVLGCTFIKYSYKIEKNKKKYFIVFEDKEISFFEADIEENCNRISINYLITNQENIYFKLDLDNLITSYDNLHILDENQREVLTHFIIDLFINKCFTFIPNYRKLKNSLKSNSFYSGLVLKQLFKNFVDTGDSNDEINLVSSYIKKKKKKIIHLYWEFLLNEKNEFFITHKSKFNYFESLEKEINTISVYVKNCGYENEFELEIELTSKLLLKRYNILEAVKIVLPKKPGAFLVGSVLLIKTMTILTVFYLYYLFNFNPNYELMSILLEILRYSFSFLIIFIPIFHLIFSYLPNLNFIINKGKYFLISSIFPQIYLPRLCIATLSGWLLFATAQETDNIFDSINNSNNYLIIFFMIFLFLSMYVLLYNEIRNTAPSENKNSKIIRSIHVLIIGLIVSIGLGCIIMFPIFNTLSLNDNTQLVKETRGILYDLENQIIDTDNKIATHNMLISRLTMSNLYSPKNEIIFSIISPNEDSTKENYINMIDTLSKLINNTPVYETRDSLFNYYSENVPDYKYKYLDSLIKILDTNSINNPIIIKQIHEFLFTEIENLQKTKLSISNLKLNLQNIDTLKSNYFNNKNKFIVINNLLLGEIEDKENKYKMQYIPFNDILNKSIIALFIGIFLQLIIHDKTVTEPV